MLYYNHFLSTSLIYLTLFWTKKEWEIFFATPFFPYSSYVVKYTIWRTSPVIKIWCIYIYLCDTFPKYPSAILWKVHINSCLSGELKSTLSKHKGPIFSLKWNKKGDYLLTGSCDKTAVVWDVKAAELKQHFEFHSGDMLFSNDYWYDFLCQRFHFIGNFSCWFTVYRSHAGCWLAK